MDVDKDKTCKMVCLRFAPEPVLSGTNRDWKRLRERAKGVRTSVGVLEMG